MKIADVLDGLIKPKAIVANNDKPSNYFLQRTHTTDKIQIKTSVLVDLG